MNRWSYICPVCRKKVVNDYSVEEIKYYIGATYDCPECNAVLKIKDDLTVGDFGEELKQIFSSCITE